MAGTRLPDTTHVDAEVDMEMKTKVAGQRSTSLGCRRARAVPFAFALFDDLHKELAAAPH
ncbi:hypothetical protein WN73_13080 [Bradyrhizobium sp. CCBAU 45394]|nr:hypothetical protein [Bradyrhizobium sp. CCBAU 45394]